MSYEISERARDGTDKVWSQAYGHVSKGTITDALSGTTLTAVPLNIYQHKYPMFTSVYHWNAGGTDGISSELSGLWSDVDNMVYSGTIGNDLSSRPVALQVYGDQSLSDFDASSLTGFYLGKLKDGSGNDVYLWAGVNAGAEQVRMDTDGKMKAGGGRIVLDASGMTTNDGTNTQVTIGTDGKMKAGAGAVVLDEYGMTLDVSTSNIISQNVKWNVGAIPKGRVGGYVYDTDKFRMEVNNYKGPIYMSAAGERIELSSTLTDSPGVVLTTSGTGASINLDSRYRVNLIANKAVVVSAERLTASGCTQIVIPTRTSDPSSPVAGSMYFNTSNNQLRIYNGSTWRYEVL